ncbi:Maf family protein [Roseivivax sp. CAU 1753]
MVKNLILASASSIRAQMLTQAGLEFRIVPARIDEEAIRHSLSAEDARPRDVADTLAEMKARKIAEKHPDALVLGCDQVLSLGRDILAKPDTMEDARLQLQRLRGQTHMLLSAAVLYQDAAPIWRHVGQARMTMRAFTDTYLDDYLDRNWDSARQSVGAYKIEEEGVRLFSQVHGDHFAILGLPLLDLLNFLTIRGDLPA